MKLVFGDNNSIEFAELKNMYSLKVFNAHDCDCDLCQYDGGECPYCFTDIEDWDEPTLDHKNARAYVGKCPACDEHFLKSLGAKTQIRFDLEKLEKVEKSPLPE